MVTRPTTDTISGDGGIVAAAPPIPVADQPGQAVPLPDGCAEAGEEAQEEQGDKPPPAQQALVSVPVGREEKCQLVLRAMDARRRCTGIYFDADPGNHPITAMPQTATAWIDDGCIDTCIGPEGITDGNTNI